MKSKRFNKKYRKNASKLHRKIGDVLYSGYFSKYKIYQEYPVNKINPDYQNSRHKFDWVVLDLKLVIEAHGEQHFKAVCFGGVSQETAQDNLMTQKYRDNIKMQAAVDAGYTYIMISYSDLDIITEDYIIEKYNLFYNNQPAPAKRKIEEDDYMVRQKIRAKEYRQQKYQVLKEIKNKWRDNDGNKNS